MGEAVYRIEVLRDRVVELLRTRTEPMKAGAIATALDLPGWAVAAGLVSAIEGGVVGFCNRGYSLEKVPLAPVNAA